MCDRVWMYRLFFSSLLVVGGHKESKLKSLVLYRDISFICECWVMHEGN